MRGLHEDFLLVQRATDSLTARLGRSPTAVELSAEVGLSEEAVLEAIVVRDGYDALSLDAPAQASDGGEPLALLDAIGRDEPRYDLVEYRQVIAGTVRALPARERAILRLHYVDDLRQSEIAERLGISQMQASRLLRRSLARLRVVANRDRTVGGQQRLAA